MVLAGTVQLQGSKIARGSNGQRTAQAVVNLLSPSHQLNNSHGATWPWKVILNVYSNPTSYDNTFLNASTFTGSGITVNYSSATTNIDAIIATKSGNSNVVKGSRLD
jgi:hypothetical protein